MPTATTVASPVTTGRFNEARFLQVARDYSTDRKGIDWLASQTNHDDAIARVLRTIESLKHMVSDGSDYTPSLALGFGSYNSATIASAILGEGMTGAQFKKKLADLGKPKK